MVKIGDKVKIDTLWADKEFPNCDGVVVAFRHNGNVAIIETKEGASPRYLHVSYLK